MQCTLCKSPNIENLAHYWKSLPAESPLKFQYAPPEEPEARAWMALLAVAAGIAFMVSGGALWGLAIAVAGLLWAAVIQAGVARYRFSPVA